MPKTFHSIDLNVFKDQTMTTTVATLWRYPVKSMMGEELNGAEITSSGLLGDRAFALVDVETGNVISAKNPKKWPSLFHFRAQYSQPLNNGAPSSVWITLPDGTVLSSDDPAINQKVSEFLGRQVVLQTQSPQDAKLEQYWPEHEGAENEISNEAVAGGAAKGTFFDYAPLHLLTTNSISALQGLYPEGRFEVRRFRPNLMLDCNGQFGFVEDDWVGKTLRIGDSLRLSITDPCPRCVMTTLAQGDLPRDIGILKNGISANRPMVPFAGRELPSVGVYARVLTPGWVKRGDSVMIEG
jgi:uncharacterized protein